LNKDKQPKRQDSEAKRRILPYKHAGHGRGFQTERQT
jgi:hypothetical protein